MNEPMVLPPCEHAWVSMHEPGHKLYWVNICMICHQPDWNFLDSEIERMREKREESVSNPESWLKDRLRPVVNEELKRAEQKEGEPVDTIKKLIPAGTSIQDKARQIVVDYFNFRVDATDTFTMVFEDTYVVWFSKTLQNWKALVSTTVVDGKYYEVTYDGDKEQAYLDVYVKLENVTVQDHPAEEAPPKQ